MPNPLVTKIEPIPNEPQPDREAQLENDLSKLFNINSEVESKVIDEPKEVEKKAEPEITQPEEKKVSEESNKPKADSEKKEKEEDDFQTKPSKDGWKILRDSHAKAKKTLIEKDQELSKLKVSLAEKGEFTSQEAEKLKKEIEELKSYRAMVDVQADPEFVSKFDEPISKRTEQISKMLSEWGVDASIISKIDYSDPGLLDRISDTIAQNKDKISAKKFLRNAEEINDLYDKRTEHLEEYKKNYKNIIETKKKESFSKQAESEGRIQNRLSQIAEMKDEKGEVQFPFLKEISAKDPSNAGEVEQAERHNKAVQFLRNKLEGALKAESPEDRADVAVAAVSAHWASAQLKAAMNKIDSLQKELSKISKSTSETPKSQRNGVNQKSDKEELDLDTAMNNFFQGAR